MKPPITNVSQLAYELVRDDEMNVMKIYYVDDSVLYGLDKKGFIWKVAISIEEVGHIDDDIIKRGDFLKSQPTQDGDES